MRIDSAAVAPGPPRTPRAVAVTIGAMIAANLAAGLLPAQAAPAYGTSAISLHDDDGGAALFGSHYVHPGRWDSACVALSATGTADPLSQVRLSAEVSRDDLAPYLHLMVERGTVGRFGDCSSFTGDLIWDGTLAEFPRTVGAGVATGWRPAVLERVIYRFSVTVVDDARAQHRDAAATFLWTLDGVAPEPAPPEDGEPEPSTDLGSGSPGAVPGGTGSGSHGGPPPQEPAGPADSGSASDHEPVVEAPPMQVGPTLVERIAETVSSLVRHVYLPVLLLAALTAFLVLQAALDRRDPKLALAPLPFIRTFRPFPEPPRIQKA